jgi:hypothetical protein
MNWAAVAAIGGVVGVIVSVGALAAQVSGLQRSVRSATYQSILQTFHGFADALLRYPQLYTLFFENGDPAALTHEDRARAEMAWTLLFNWYEALILQHELYHAVPAAVAEHWMNVLRQDLQQPAIRELWNRQGRYYHPRLQARVTYELNQLPGPKLSQRLEARHVSKTTWL